MIPTIQILDCSFGFSYLESIAHRVFSLTDDRQIVNVRDRWIEIQSPPATITLQRVGVIGGECCVGNGGEDLLKDAGFTIDFSAMTLWLNNAKR